MDPLLTALGLELAAGAIVDSGKAVAGALFAWAKGDEVTQLFLELDARFGNIPGLSATGLEPLRGDARFLELLALFWSTGSFPRDDMISTIEPHVGRTETQTPREVAELIADAIDLYSARARESRKELFAIEALRQSLNAQLKTIRQEIQTTPSVFQRVTVEWAPPLSRERLERMLKDAPADLAPLQASLREHEDPRPIIEGLASNPPSWLESGSHRTWEALGEVADGYALWSAASAAFEHAADLPGGDRTMLLARASICARLAGEITRFLALLERARALDEDHAQVILARLLPDAAPEERLAILDAAPVQAESRRQAALDIARAVAYAEKGEWDEADRLLASVRETASDHPGLRGLAPALVIGRNRVAAGKGHRVDAVSLRAAADELLALRADMAAAFRYGESGRLLAEAVTALAIAGDMDEAAVLLDQIRDEETSDRTSAMELSEAALVAERIEIARSLAPAQPRNDREELAAVHPVVYSSDSAAIEHAVQKLDRLLYSEDEAVRAEAAFARQVAALDASLGPSPEAQAILEHESPSLAALLTAERLHRDGRRDEAETLVLPHQDDVRILRAFIRWAVQDEQWDRVLELSRAVVSKEPTPLDRLVFAEALYRANERQETIAVLTSLRRDNTAPRAIRGDAYSLSARIASDDFDFSNLERIATEWLGFDPSSKPAAWNVVYALFRLARSVEAVQFAERLGLEPETLGQAELLAAVLDDGDDPETAARRTAELSDRFDRPERLEAQFLLSAIRVRPEQRLEDLKEEIQTRLASFPKRFPESRIIRAVPVDTSPAGIDAFFREHVEPGAEQVQEVSEQLRRGEAPIATLAAVAGRPVSIVTLQLERALPLRFADPALDSLEQESANQALTRAVVWDPVALAVVASLPREISEAIRNAFPASITPQATIDDLNRAIEGPTADRTEHSVIGYDPVTSQRFMYERSAEEVSREREAIDRSLEIAQSLQVTPDVDPVRPTDFDPFLQDPDRNAAFAIWPAVLATAQREHKPLYSDDRFVRLQARKLGIPAFGTLAALEALVARGLISDEQRLAARSQLRRMGAMGVGATLEELLTEARAADWCLIEGIAYTLLDPTTWAHPVLALETFRKWGVFLRVAFEEAPDKLDSWVYRFLDAADRNLPGRTCGFLAQALLLISWQPFDPKGRPFLQTLIRVLRNARVIFGWYPDPVQATSQWLSNIRQDQQPEIHGVLVRAFLQDLGFLDQLMVMGLRLDR